MIAVGPMQGRLARDPDFDFVGPSQTPRWKATLAVDEPRYNPQTRSSEVGTLWIFMQAWGTLAEDLANAGYAQGDELAVNGRLDQFTVGEGDKKDTKTHVVPLFVQATRRKSAPPTSRPAHPGPTAHAPAEDPWGTSPPPATDEPPF